MDRILTIEEVYVLNREFIGNYTWYWESETKITKTLGLELIR